MTNKLLFLELALVTFVVFSIFVGSQANGQVNQDKNNEFPKPVAESVTQLKKSLSKQILSQLQNEPEANLIKYHLSLGGGIRNEFIYGHSDSPLVKFFLDKGIRQPDDMSDIIIHCLWADLHKQWNDLNKQIDDYKKSEMSTEAVLDKPTAFSQQVLSIPIEIYPSGRTVKISDLKGKVVVLSALTTGCKKQVDMFNKIRSEFPQADLEIIGLVLKGDDDETDSQRIEFMMKEHPSFPMALKNPPFLLKGLCEAYHQYGLKIPETFVISKNGVGILVLNGWNKETFSILHNKITLAMKER